jgi:hypothetical protein
MHGMYLGIQCCVAGEPKYALKPMITDPQHPIVRKGKNLVLECKGLADNGKTVTVMWLHPNGMVCQFCICLFLSQYVCKLSFL